MTLLTALTFWFGYEIVKTRSGYFGLDATVLGYSTSDYLLRSVTAVLLPLLVLLVVGVAALSIHAAISRLVAGGGHRLALTTIAWVVIVAGVVGAGLGQG